MGKCHACIYVICGCMYYLPIIATNKNDLQKNEKRGEEDYVDSSQPRCFAAHRYRVIGIYNRLK